MAGTVIPYPTLTPNHQLFSYTESYSPTSDNTGITWCDFHSDYFNLYYSTWNPVLTLGYSCTNIGSNDGKAKGPLVQVQTGGQLQWVGGFMGVVLRRMLRLLRLIFFNILFI